MKVTTESGSVYEFDMDKLLMRRIGSHEMRRDEEWVRMLQPTEIVVGERMHIALEPLGWGDVTMRHTTEVVVIEGEE